MAGYVAAGHRPALRTPNGICRLSELAPFLGAGGLGLGSGGVASLNHRLHAGMPPASGADGDQWIPRESEWIDHSNLDTIRRHDPFVPPLQGNGAYLRRKIRNMIISSILRVRRAEYAAPLELKDICFGWVLQICRACGAGEAMSEAAIC